MYRGTPIGNHWSISKCKARKSKSQTDFGKIFFKVLTKGSDQDQLNQIETRLVTKPSTGKNDLVDDLNLNLLMMMLLLCCCVVVAADANATKTAEGVVRVPKNP